MKFVKLIHNPQAGEAENTMHELTTLLKNAGYECGYSSTKSDDWEKLYAKETDLIVVAGGDGTIRKAALEFLDKRLPIALLPMGTANNIAKSLGIEGDLSDIVCELASWQRKPFDIGAISNVKEEKFFLEAMGFGIFPRLIKEMNFPAKGESKPPKTLRSALEVLHDIVLDYEAKACKIQIDDAEYSGKYLLVEIMNTSSIGPNLSLASFADPGDGAFEVVLITEAQREEFATYVLGKIMGKDEPPFFNILKAKKLKIAWESPHLHVDDNYIKLAKPVEIKVELVAGALSFLVPERKEVETTASTK